MSRTRRRVAACTIAAVALIAGIVAAAPAQAAETHSVA
jgi:hypothetical protein